MLCSARCATNTHLVMTRQDRQWEGERKPQARPRTAEAIRYSNISTSETGSRAQIPALPPVGTAFLVLHPAMDF